MPKNPYQGEFLAGNSRRRRKDAKAQPNRLKVGQNFLDLYCFNR
jgi:hypothetical protein